MSNQNLAIVIEEELAEAKREILERYLGNIIEEELAGAKSRILERFEKECTPNPAEDIPKRPEETDPQAVADEELAITGAKLTGSIGKSNFLNERSVTGLKIGFQYGEDSQIYTSSFGTDLPPSPDDHSDDDRPLDRDELQKEFVDAPLSLDEIDEIIAQIGQSASNKLRSEVTGVFLYTTIDSYRMATACLYCSGGIRRGYYSYRRQAWICTIYTC